MTRAESVPECGVWTAAGHEIQIEYSHAVMDQIRAAAVVGLCRFPRGGLEIGGVLFGAYRSGLVRVLAARPVQCGYAHGPSFLLAGEDAATFERALLTDSDPTLAGLEPVGWYQSHTRSGLELRPADIANHDRYFPEPWQVALVVRPEPFGSAAAAFFLRGSAESLHPEPASDILLRPEWKAGRRSPEPVDRLSVAADEAPPAAAVRPIQAPKPPSRSPRAVPPVQRPWPPLPPPPPELRPRLSPKWAGALVLLVAFAVWIAIRRGQQTPPQPSSQRERVVAPVRPAPPQEPEATALLTPPAAVQEASSPPEPPPAVLTELPARNTRRDRQRRIRTDEPELPAATRPFRMAAPPRRSTRQAALPSPPPVQAGTLPQPVPITAVEVSAPPPPAPAAPARNPAYSGPSAGRVIWTGQLPTGGVLTIDGQHASAGFVNAELPGVPVRISAHSAELSSEGLRVNASSISSMRGIKEPPSAQNGWNATVYAFDRRRAADVLVVDTPSAQNGWKGLAVRSNNRPVSVIVIDWRVAPAN